MEQLKQITLTPTAYVQLRMAAINNNKMVEFIEWQKFKLIKLVGPQAAIKISNNFNLYGTYN